MRISDWSSDVCSSDLRQLRCDPLALADIVCSSLFLHLVVLFLCVGDFVVSCSHGCTATAIPMRGVWSAHWNRVGGSRESFGCFNRSSCERDAARPVIADRQSTRLNSSH